MSREMFLIRYVSWRVDPRGERTSERLAAVDQGESNGAIKCGICAWESADGKHVVEDRPRRSVCDRRDNASWPG